MERTDAEHERLVRWFSALMLRTLERNAHKPHWLTMTAEERAEKMGEEQAELDAAVAWRGPESTIAEAVDVALVAAFEADHARHWMEGGGGDG